jgi:hypothetical protein
MTKNPSYIPDLLLMKLPRHLSRELFIFKDEDEFSIDLSSPMPASLFLHEWLHYVHNISTLSGIYSFACIIHLWVHFRNGMDSSGFFVGKNESGEYNKLAVAELLKRNKIFRRQLNEKTSIDFIEICGVSKEEEPLLVANNGVEAVTVIVCSIKSGDRLNPTLAAIKIGVVEIIEGLAFLLEERFLTGHCELPQKPKVVPYKLLSTLAIYIVNDIDKDDIIACALTSLQFNDPPCKLMELLNEIKPKETTVRKDFLEKIAKNHLDDSAVVMAEIFNSIEGFFPLDEPMGMVIKDLIGVMKHKMELRKRAPFFELMMLDQIKKEKVDLRSEKLEKIIAEFSCPRILASKPIKDDDIDHDYIFIFGNPSLITEESTFGFQKLHSAFHFLGLHFGEDCFQMTEAITASSTRKRCPFYTACRYELRKEKPTLCELTPWESLKLEMDPRSACWYRAGVRATMPPG